jgi:hypothetical protein
LITKIYEKPSALQMKIKETSIMRKNGDKSVMSISKDKENYVDPLSLKISLEKMIFLVSKSIDPNLDKNAKNKLDISDYTCDKEKKKEKKKKI